MRRASLPFDPGDLARLLPGLMSVLVLGCLDPQVTVRLGAATVDSCNGVADDALCNDQNPCTQGDKCQAGVCVGTPAVDGMPCTDGNQCTARDACDQGLCKGTPVADGTRCTDGEPCTDPDLCLQGSCVTGPAKICDDGIACTLDHCVTGIGCQSDVTPQCPDGDAGGVTDATLETDTSPPSDGPDMGQPDGADATAGNDADAGGSPDATGTPDADASAVADGGRDADAISDRNAVADADGPGVADADGAGGRDADAATNPDGADAGVDGGGANDALDDGGENDMGPREFDARGGACVCEIAAAPPPGASFCGFAVAVGLLLRRRRRR